MTYRELPLRKPELEHQNVLIRRPKYWGMEGKVASLYRLLKKAEAA